MALNATRLAWCRDIDAVRRDSNGEKSATHDVDFDSIL
jgi:hypothetical protein